MIEHPIPEIFRNAFDTFRAFEGLTLATAGPQPQPFPTTIWQILNHLVIWQAHQLRALRGEATQLHEPDSWIPEQAPPDQAALDGIVRDLNAQLKEIEVSLRTKQGQCWPLLQEMALHLSFHLGEVVLMRRLQGSYPMPHEMRAFLATDDAGEE